MASLPYLSSRVHRTSALLTLLDYAMTHRHSYQWINAIGLLMQKGGNAHV
jgi:hypothetical protein